MSTRPPRGAGRTSLLAAHSPRVRETGHSTRVSLPLRRPWHNDGIKQ